MTETPFSYNIRGINEFSVTTADVAVLGCAWSCRHGRQNDLVAQGGNLLGFGRVVGGDAGDGSGEGKDESESANSVLHNVVTPLYRKQFFVTYLLTLRSIVKKWRRSNILNVYRYYITDAITPVTLVLSR